MKQLKNLYVFRKYDTFLDFRPLVHHPTLSSIFLNNRRNISIIPIHIQVYYGCDKLLDFKIYKTRNFQEKDYSKYIEEPELLSPKEYFIGRYNSKRKTKLKNKLSSSI
jgi:hypothetical protein